MRLSAARPEPTENDKGLCERAGPAADTMNEAARPKRHKAVFTATGRTGKTCGSAQRQKADIAKLGNVRFSRMETDYSAYTPRSSSISAL